ncbi:uncharacterized protein LOC128554164 [Mercenaria mercenaria]|uniref:uncharacterized protein LOC128554164 n=1 Tax=Mercenaria mercenaria TaxID=6596 RepID=UPI00234F0FDD|nr:uncharacterized protein LOC128554164 [Mercenaria mercenaria]
MGYQPKIIKKAIEQILRQNDSQKITAQILMEKVLEIEEAEKPPQTVPAPNASAAAHAKPASETASEEGASSGNLKTERNGNKIEKGKASAEDKHKSTGKSRHFCSFT